MELFKKSIFLLLTGLCFTFCGSNNQIKMVFPQEIATAYYETSAEVEQQIVHVNFYIDFKEPLSTEIRLQKVYFRNQEAPVEKVTNKKYVAHFPSTAVKDYILDSDRKKEYGNKAPIIVKPKFKLNLDEAVLEYQKNNETIFFKLRKIEAKQ